METDYNELSVDEFKEIIRRGREKRGRKKDTSMKLNYTSKRTITTADLFDACDPPLIFEVRTRPPKGWAQIDLDFSETDHTDVELAKRMIAGVFLTVSEIQTVEEDKKEEDENPDYREVYPIQTGEVYPIQTVEQVEALQQAIESENPGYGEDFLLTIAWGFSRNYYSYIGKHLGNSLKPLLQSDDNGQGKSKVKVS